MGESALASPGPMPSQPSNSLLGLDLQELTNLALASDQPAYRGQQLFDALYRQRIDRLDQVSTLPLDYRARLAEEGWGVGVVPDRESKRLCAAGSMTVENP